ncbi:hypothetical protein [Luteolibacter soli]|uniref:DUF3592 domain-containing protein n=1 Tax=Luteolibacter soli TaxID=3135280 RepID=A0ABU9B4F9_9BACT
MLFLLWAWAESNIVRYTLFLPASELNSTQGKLLWWATGSDGTYDVQLDYRTSHVTLAEVGRAELFFGRCVFPMAGEFESQPVAPGEMCWFPALRWESVDINAATFYRLVAVPYWLLMTGYAAIFAGGITVRQRRKVRLMKIVPPP